MIKKDWQYQVKDCCSWLVLSKMMTDNEDDIFQSSEQLPRYNNTCNAMYSETNNYSTM